MELFRALGALLETPDTGDRRLADLLELGPAPPESETTELFLFQLYPYASVYLGAGGQLGGEARDRIAGFWRALGETPPAEPDHLTVMLALQAELAEREEGAEGEHRDRWRRARRAFLYEHLLSWLPAWLAKLDDLAPPYYRRWGALLEEALAAEVEKVGREKRLSLHLRAAPPLVDPRSEAPAAFLDALLSPVQSGAILTRADLARAASECGLGMRAGERKFVLKALLSQAPAPVLAWLAGELDAWSKRHRAQPTAFAPASGFWAERAADAARLVGELAREPVAS